MPPLDTLVIASHNPGKAREIAELLAPFPIRVVSAAEAGIPEPEETGASFEANANLKSAHAARHSGKAALADDSGLAVEALDGAPGIYSARWAGPDKDFKSAMHRIRAELEQRNIPRERWRAWFVCALSLSLPDGTQHCFTGEVNGHLIFPPRGNRGFGYDPIFRPDGYAKTFGEMDPAEKHRISHRARAFAQFVTWLEGA